MAAPVRNDGTSYPLRVARVLFVYTLFPAITASALFVALMVIEPAEKEHLIAGADPPICFSK